MPSVTLWGAGLLMLVVGTLHLSAPQMMMDSAGIALTSVNHLHVIRTAYGGGFIGIGALFLLGALQPAHQRASLIAVAVLFSGFAIGRLASIAADGVPVPLYLAVLAVEVVFATLAILSLRAVK